MRIITDIDEAILFCKGDDACRLTLVDEEVQTTKSLMHMLLHTPRPIHYASQFDNDWKYLG